MTFPLRTFRRGIHPPANKFTKDAPLQEFPTPDTVFISLSQHIGAPATPTVAVGDHVDVGQVIASASGFVSANVISSVSGTVKAFCTLPTANGGEATHIEIENDHLFTEQRLSALNDPTKEEIIERIKAAGIVGMGGATFPTHVKLMPKDPIDTLIINGAECEPYITCDYRLFMEEAVRVIDGVKLLMKALDVKHAYIGIEANKLPAIKRLAKLVPPEIDVMKLKTKYPQGAEKQLIFAITHRTVPTGALPAKVGCVVCNTHTAYCVAKAVRDGETCYKRAMTVSGGGVEMRGNFWVRNGTPYQFIYDTCRGNVIEDVTRKVISGGPMMGFAQADLNVATTKGSSCLLFLTDKEFNTSPTTPCISCGKCILNCPMSLVPREIERAEQKEDFETTFKLGVLNCIECGACSYSCPAKRPLVQAMRLAKKEIKARGIK